MADPLPPPEVSPTGAPVAGQAVVKIGLSLIGLGTSAMAALEFLPDVPWKSKAQAGAVLAIGVGGMLTGTGPGLRAKGTSAAEKVKTTQDVVDVLNRPAP